MENPRFSIVIPTRNRANTLEFCLKTCIEQQDFDNYEILVCDNNSTPETKKVVDKLNSKKIRYISTGQTLAMYENFEFAVSHAKGEYVIVIGDDDGLLLKGLFNLDKIITKTNYKAITWNWVFYYWPFGVTPGCENFLHIPLSTKVKVMEGKQRIKDVIDFKLNYSFLPMLYTNGAIHRDLIAELKKRTGRIFSSVTPDCYSGICLAYLSEYFLFVEKPLSIAGISANSNGNSQFTKKWDNKITQEFTTLNSSAKINFHHKIPNIRSLNAIVAEVFMQAKALLFPDDEALIADRKTIIINCLKDLISFDLEEWNNSIDIVRESLTDSIELSNWFETILPDLKPNITDITLKRNVHVGLDGDSLITFNASSFNCKNVYDVANFYNKAFESEVTIPDNLRYIEDDIKDIIVKPQIKVSPLKTGYLRIKKAARILIKGY